MEQLLEGIVIGGYRSFGPQPAHFGPLGKINLLVGRNNTGKSNLLRFLSTNLATSPRVIKGEAQLSVDPVLDAHRGIDGPQATLGLGLVENGPRHREIQGTYPSLITRGFPPDTPALIDRFFAVLFAKSSCVWLIGTATSCTGAYTLQPPCMDILISGQPIDQDELLTLQRVFTDSGGGAPEDQVRAIFARLLPDALPAVATVPAIRRVGDPDSEYAGFSGSGLIKRIAQLQSPARHDSKLTNDFEALTSFVRTVFDRPDATLRIPFEQNELIVALDGIDYPLASLGTGVHEVIILAAAATSLSGQIICLEEPEIHLHPILQRKLLLYLSEHTDNQYVIATHSAHMLDAPDTVVFHLTSNGTATTVAYSDSEVSRVRLCFDLGYRASDLVQANAVIWVEGPSDRVYLRHWLAKVDSELIEGIHFSVMFYGGRLLSHLSGADLEPLVDEFIALRRINQHAAIIMDSDKDAPKKHINATKKRVRDEFLSADAFVWITAGREVENYVSPVVLNQAVKKVHPKGRLKWDGEPFDPPLKISRHGGGEVRPDKVAIAHAVTECDSFENRIGLHGRCVELATYIRQANDEARA